ncbi:MAG: DUF2862 domain-containing protein [Synechococcales cyanobacterium RM1_1_8]|nr:DUF2862 domain-containing protein [Synechococcales cyanobacterium RM1_1_8]
MEIGQTVRVLRVRDRIPANVVSKLKQNPVGVIQGYRVVDGMGIGLVVKFDEGFSTWFFEDELQAEA